LLPNATYQTYERFGQENPPHPKPVRLYLPNKVEKDTMLSNRKLLHDQDDFKGISVQPDLTKFQQSERKSRIQTRSQTKK